MTTIRENLEQWEEVYLSPYAALSKHSLGRMREEEPCDIRPVFQRDRDRILHCKAFRRLRDKTQVFLAPQGDHYRTRLTHTLEVSQNARTIAKALRMNEDLVEAIALGHDLGHTPFGHAGERALERVCPYGFVHSEQSVRVVDALEKDGQGLNLTFEVRDGIKNHQTAGVPATLEGKIVRYSDKIAYIHHDCDDAIRAGLLKESDIPREVQEVVGKTTGERLDHFIHDIVTNSMGKNDIVMSETVADAMKRIRQFMFDHVYYHPVVKQEEAKAQTMLNSLFFWYMEHPENLPEEFQGPLYNDDKETAQKKQEISQGFTDEIARAQAVCDYIAGMTDHYAIARFEELFVPKGWRSR